MQFQQLVFLFILNCIKRCTHYHLCVKDKKKKKIDETYRFNLICENYFIGYRFQQIKLLLNEKLKPYNFSESIFS